MRQSINPSVTRYLISMLSALASFCALSNAPLFAQNSSASDARLIAAFDFNERLRGNFEDLPMYWRRLARPGLPAYSRGVFDHTTGFGAPPSFRLDLRGGAMCYQYEGNEIPVTPGDTYRLIARVRTQGLENARAFLAGYMVDETGRRLSGTETVSTIVPDSSHSPSPNSNWTAIHMDVHVHVKSARHLRLQAWVAPSAWFPVTSGENPDPIEQADMNATIWFDDIAILQLPRLMIELSTPGGIIQRGERAAFQIALSSHAGEKRPLRLEIQDVNQKRVFSEDYQTVSGARIELPDLPAGYYEARCESQNGPDVRLQRSLAFAVVEPLQPREPATDLGLDLTALTAEHTEFLSRATRWLNCKAAKLRIPLFPEEPETYTRLAKLARDLRQTGVLTVGAFDWTTREGPDSAATERAFAAALKALGEPISVWQAETDALDGFSGAPWDEERVDDLERELSKFMPAPQVIAPESVFSAPPALKLAGPDQSPPAARTGAPALEGRSFALPQQVPARNVPWLLAFLFDADESPRLEGAPPPHTARWLTLTGDAALARNTSEFAQTFVLAKAANIDALFIPAPFTWSTSGGGAGAWQPTRAFPALRTLAHFLGERRCVRTLPLDNDSIGLIFEGPSGSCLVAWTWRSGPESVATGLPLPSDVRAFDLLGQAVEVKTGSSAVLNLTPNPIFIEGFDVGRVLLERSLQIGPQTLEAQDRRAQLQISLRNDLSSILEGTLDLISPPEWDLERTSFALQVEPGEEWRAEVAVLLPERLVRDRRTLQATLKVTAPDEFTLTRKVPITIGLREVPGEIQTRWEGDQLVIEHTLRNFTQQPVSFAGYCEAPQRRRVERDFVNISPGGYQTAVYRVQGARSLIGRTIRIGIREMRGGRTVEQLVQIAE